MSQISSQVHYNAVLTDVAVQFKPPALRWSDVFLPKSVTMESDVWPVFDKSLFNAPDTYRADGTESNEDHIGWKYDPYTCEEHALHDVLTKRMRDNSDNELDLEAAMTEAVKQKVENVMELKVFGASGTGLLRNTANNIYNANLNWSNLSTSSPRSDIQAAIDAVEAAAAVTPNTIVLARNVARHITRTAEYREEAKYTVDIRNEELPDQLYGLRAVYVGALTNTAKRGQATSLSRVMGTDVWVGYVNPNGLGYREITYGACLYTEEYASMWWEDKRRADVIEYGRIYSFKLIARECGAILTDVLA